MAYSKPLYRILEIYIPLSVVILWAPIPGILYRLVSLDPVVVFYESLWCIAAFFCAIISSFYVIVVKKNSMQLRIADLRGGIFMLLLSYFFVSMFLNREIPIPNKFLPSVNSVGAGLASFVTWFSVIFIKKIFNGLELFASFTASYKTDELQHNMREFAPEMMWTEQELKSLIRQYGLQFIPPSLVLSAPAIGNPPLFTALVFFLFCTGFLLMGYLGLQRRELVYACEGISLGIRDKVLPIPIIALGIAIAIVVSMAGSSDKSFLPPEIVFGFFAWLGSLLMSLFTPMEPLDFSFLQRQSGPSMQSASALTETLEEGVPWEGWIYVRYVVIGILAFLFFLFMVYPFLKSRGFTLNPKLLLAAIINWAQSLKKDILAFLSAFKEKGSSIKMPDREKLQKIKNDLLSGTTKRKDVKSSVNLFARLILWGIDDMKVPWKPSFAPGEYAGLLSEAVFSRAREEQSEIAGDTSRGISRSAELFEKALYSDRQLSREELKEYRLLVEGIIEISF